MAVLQIHGMDSLISRLKPLVEETDLQLLTTPSLGDLSILLVLLDNKFLVLSVN